MIHQLFRPLKLLPRVSWNCQCVSNLLLYWRENVFLFCFYWCLLLLSGHCHLCAAVFRIL